MAFAEELLEEVCQSLKVLLIVVVVGDVADDRVAFLGRCICTVPAGFALLGWEYIAAVLTQWLELLRVLGLRLSEQASQRVVFLARDLLYLVRQIEALDIADD